MIAVIGWGSLIWCQRSLRTRSRWHCDGPVLPIESARISADGRLTLVVDAAGARCRTYWAVSAFDTIDGAKEDLWQREGKPSKRYIHWVDSGQSSQPAIAWTEEIRQWMQVKQLSGAVWTGLPSNWTAKRAQPFSVDEAAEYVRDRIRKHGADSPEVNQLKEYVVSTPSQIKTPVRSRLQKDLNWEPQHLFDGLFESKS